MCYFIYRRFINRVVGKMLMNDELKICGRKWFWETKKKNANFSGELYEPKENEVNSFRMLHS